MSASNYSWVCFECRVISRQPKEAVRIPKCSGCRADMVCLGYKIEIPRKEDARGWRRLRDDCRERAMDAADVDALDRVREHHEAERRIAQLSALPPNKERMKLITELRRKNA